MTITPDRPTLLLVHGAWHGSWSWQKLEGKLAADGWATRSVQLPSAVVQDAPAEPLPGMYDDADVVRTALAEISGPVVVVAHSYGGIPVTEATAGATNVVHLVYLASYQLDVGEAMLPFHGVPVPDSLAGTLPVTDPATGRARGDFFYQDLDVAEAAEANARLVPQSVRACFEPVTRVGWRSIPSTYVVADKDQALSPSDQERMARRAGAVHHLPSGHSPFLSMPGALASLLARIAAGAGTEC
ncbi:alpha/beta fold hydrolase [Micromonospora sp. NBC_01796]|uniref:alpha/beta fold hydrolase n=1 Tax=Micromonospora sp. NBC_01796 TaxID=2975987 RepID=UPI002DD86C61|nr:alpha/beta fold hydrolase [Micromonospora sp. NBC_01796]WSA84181.1 alpha/beta fold hydrolase [Micromonospora sp. NBC_01796]